MPINEHILIDARHKERAYRELAKSFISTEDIWIAFHAQFFSDLANILILELDSPALKNEIGAIPLLNTLSSMNIDLRSKDARQVMDTLRNNIEELLNVNYRSKWRENLAPIDYLRDKKLTIDNARLRKNARLRGLDPYSFVESKFREADINARETLISLQNNDKNEALRTAYASDMAVFEAWLVSRSIFSDDDNLILTELKWSLAMTALSAPRNPADEFSKTIGDIRSRLVWAVGPTDARSLAKHFAKLI